MIRYRFYVGLKGGSANPARRLTVEEVTSHVALILTGATVIPSFGVWQGSWEPSCIIEVVTTLATPLEEATAEARAVELARLLDQDAVLLTREVSYPNPKFFGPTGEVQP